MPEQQTTAWQNDAKRKKTAHSDKDKHAKEVHNSNIRKIEKQNQVAILDDWGLWQSICQTQQFIQH